MPHLDRDVVRRYAGADGLPATTARTGDADPRTLPTPAEIAMSVAALPALPAVLPGDRYSPRQLTVSWLSEVAKSRYTVTGYFDDLSTYLTWCESRDLDPLRARRADIGDYQRERQQRVGPATVNRAMSALSSWYRYLQSNGTDCDNPAAAVSRPYLDRDYSPTVGLTVDEVGRLLHWADEEVRIRAQALQRRETPAVRVRYLAALRDRALIRLMASLGLRVGEVVGLNVDDLGHEQHDRVVRFTAKGSKPRRRLLEQYCAQAVDEYLQHRAAAQGVRVEALTGPLFATTTAGGTAGRVDRFAVHNLVRRLARAANLPNAQALSPHSLRHAFATNSRAAGVPLEDVQDAMGHADPRTTRRYDRDRNALDRDPSRTLGARYATANQAEQPDPAP